MKKVFDKFWFLLWKDESFKGWIFSIVVLFIFIKLIFFPTLSFLTGTSLPLAIVESCSMYHDGNLLSNNDVWWNGHKNKYEKYNISGESFLDFKFNDGLNKGDILFIVGANIDELEKGDVIIFTANQRNPVIHRIIDIRETENGRVFSTLGDNNNGQLAFEKNIKEEQIVGRAMFKIAPYIGWGKLIFFESQKDSRGRGFCIEN